MKLNSLQFLRAFAAILVVINHLWFAGSISQHLRLDGIGGFGVDIFFVISGFIMCYTLNDNHNLSAAEKSRDFISKRVIRIYPTYWVALIPALFVFTFNLYTKKADFDLQSLIGSFLLIPDLFNNPKYHMILGVAWTLVYEMFFYFVFALSIYISRTKTQSIVTFIGIIISLIVITNVLGLKGNRYGWCNFYYIIGDTLLLNFVLGACCYFLLTYSKGIILKPITAVVLFSILFVVGVKLSHLGFPRIVAFGIPSFLIVLVFLATNFDRLKSHNLGLMILLGDASYSIYLIHPNFTFLTNYATRLPVYLVDIYGVGLVVFAVLIGVLFHKKVELPLLASIKKWRNSYSVQQ